MKIKVCGMREQSNIEQLVALSPDFIGFIFYPKSKRFAKDELNLDVLKSIPKSIQKVGVFVNASLEEIQEIMNEFGLDMIQLHGDESSAFCKEVKQLGFPIVKAFGVDENFDFTITKAYKESCSYFLFDTKGKDYGGHGVTFDWSILDKYDNELPFFLSGGLDQNNIHEVLELEKSKHLSIIAVDVNSKFEIEPALKNIELLQKSVFRVFRNE